MVALLLSRWAVPVYPAQAAEVPVQSKSISPLGVAPNAMLNEAPNVPGNPTPANGATYVLTTTTLSWSGGDPDGGPVTYTVSFGTHDALAVVDSNVTTTTYDPGSLDYNLTYYWQITATDGLSTTVGPLWSFSTESDPAICTLYASTDTPMPLEDDGVVTSTLTVADNYIVGDVNVTLNISHTWDADLEMTLISPDDTRSTLIYKIGVGGQGFFGTMLDDEADTHIWFGTPPYTGRFRPYEDFGAFITKRSNGIWRLEIVDHAAGDTGILEGWQLELCSMEMTNRAPFTPSGPWPPDGAIDIPTTLTLSWTGGDPDGNIVTYTVALGTTTPPPVVGVNVTTTTYTPASLSAQTVYTWYIAATDGFSTTVGPLWSFTTAPLSPVSFSKTGPTNGETGVSTAPTLTWEPSSGAVSYEYCYSSIAPTCPDDVWTSTGVSTSVALTGLLDGTIYHWQVRAVNTGGTTAANDGTWWSFTTANINNPPLFTSTPVTTVMEGDPYTYTVTVDDPDLIWGDVLTITAPTLPAWLTFTVQGEVTATLTGTPTSAEVGTHAVVLHVTDSEGLMDIQAFTITVAFINDAPFFTSTPVTTATQNVLYTYSITADDPDLALGDALTLTAPTRPAWLTLADHGDGTATLSGTPPETAVGDHAVVLYVTDRGGMQDTQAFTVTVANVNDAPFFTSTPVTVTRPGALYTYTVTADDPDLDWGDVLTITAPMCPAWLTLTDHGDGTALLTGMPTATDGGEHAVQLRVTDSAGLMATQTFTITVPYQIYLPLVLRNAP